MEKGSTSTPRKMDLLQTVAKIVPALGIILGMLAGISFGLAIVLAKYIYHISPFTQLLVRGLLHYSVCLAVSIYQQVPIIPRTDRKHFCILFVSASLSALVPVFIYTAFKFISVADTVAILFTYPAIVALISALFLGDRCSFIHVLVVGLSVAGSVLVAKPSGIFGDSWDVVSYVKTIYGVLLAFSASVSFALYLISLRKLSNIAWPTLNTQAGFCLVVLSAIALPMLTDLKLPNCGLDGPVMVFGGLLSTLGVVFTVLACKVENPRNVSVSQTIEMPVTIVFEVLIIGTIPSWNSYLGTTFIIVSVLLTWVIKWWETRKQSKSNALNALESELLQESSV